jgi:hypothetical protein
MICIGAKVGLGGALAGVGASGTVVVVGAPTVAGSVAGLLALAGSLTGVVVAMQALIACYEAHDRPDKAAILQDRVDRLEAEIANLKARFT